MSFLSDSVKNEVTWHSPHSAFFEQIETIKDEDTLSNSYKSVSSDKKREPESERECVKTIEESELHQFKKYFRNSDWMALLFILNRILRDKNNALKLLWNFIDKFEGKRKIHKGKNVFKILQFLELE